MTAPAPDSDSGFKQLAVLADPDRLHLSACLLNGPQTAAELARGIDKSLAVTLDHLQRMVDVGFVQVEGVGEFASYSFRPEITLSALGIGDPTTLNLGCCQLTLTQISPPDRE